MTPQTRNTVHRFTGEYVIVDKKTRMTKFHLTQAYLKLIEKAHDAEREKREYYPAKKIQERSI